MEKNNSIWMWVILVGLGILFLNQNGTIDLQSVIGQQGCTSSGGTFIAVGNTTQCQCPFNTSFSVSGSCVSADTYVTQFVDGCYNSGGFLHSPSLPVNIIGWNGTNTNTSVNNNVPICASSKLFRQQSIESLKGVTLTLAQANWFGCSGCPSQYSCKTFYESNGINGSQCVMDSDYLGPYYSDTLANSQFQESLTLNIDTYSTQKENQLKNSTDLSVINEAISKKAIYELITDADKILCGSSGIQTGSVISPFLTANKSYCNCVKVTQSFDSAFTSQGCKPTTICPQVITTACNIATKQLSNYSTPCNIPTGYTTDLTLCAPSAYSKIFDSFKANWQYLLILVAVIGGVIIYSKKK